MQDKTNIVCVESDSQYSTYLSGFLKAKQVENHKTITISQLEELFSETESYLCFIDFNTALKEHKRINRLTGLNKHYFTSIYAAPKNITTSTLIQLGRIKGYFHLEMNQQHFLSGVNSILLGKNQLPNNIAYQLIEYYQALIVRYSEPYRLDLTQREIQVLKYLQNGLSNTKLADELFVSEHTIKSHLYRIFRKLHVSNRIQAMAWAHKYLT